MEDVMHNAEAQAPANNQIDATAAAAAELDALTRKLTGFKTFAGLLAGGELPDGTPDESAYMPSIFPQPHSTAAEHREYKQLADAYDAAQTLKGDKRRAYRGDAAWWKAPRQRSRREVVAILARAN